MADDWGEIAEYGLIGDCRTAALVRRNGAIEWMCLPDFDGPSVFARILDPGVGGQFRIAPTAQARFTQEYVGTSAVLRTTFDLADGGQVQLTDFMALSPGDAGHAETEHRLIRIVQGGPAEVSMELHPRPDYGAQPARLRREGDGAVFHAGEVAVRLQASVPLEVADNHAGARFHVRPEEPVAFAMDLLGRSSPSPIRDLARESLGRTLEFWARWTSQCAYRGAYEAMVKRSLITLKLLTYEPTGAMVAAPTTSLPEEIGGVRNWDYRFTWIRDASLASSALFLAGHPVDARRFLEWVCDVALRCEPGAVAPLYGLRGERELPERVLPQLRGYRDSAPVRIGNLARDQFQLDTYGELLDCFDAIRRWRALDPHVIEDVWPAFRAQVDAVATSWREPDSGIWEMRTEPLHFVFSKAMAWAALDRGIAAAEAGWPTPNARAWRAAREEVKAEVLRHGVDSIRNCFLQAYRSSALDAANILIPLFRFIAADDGLAKATLDATMADLMSKGMLYRYKRVDDGLPGREATFAACTFWLAQALAAAGRTEQARAIFESMLARATPLGLFAEQIDPLAGHHRGNFPQALSHIALLNAALAMQKP